MPTPAVAWKGSAVLEEQPDSPQWQFGDKLTCVRVWRGPYALCLTSAPVMGVVATGDQAGLYVAASTVTREAGTIGVLTINYESLGGEPTQGSTLPPDEAEVILSKTEVSLEKHPRYASLADLDIDVDGNPVAVLSDINTLLNTSTDDSKYLAAANSVLANSLAHELYLKLQSGFTHYPVSTPTYRLTQHYWNCPADLEMGVYREDPPSVPVIPPPGEWLRYGDSVSFNGSTWKVVREWIGAPAFDADIYP